MWKRLGAWEFRACRMKCPGGLGVQRFLDSGSLILQMVRLRETRSLHEAVSMKLKKISGTHGLLLHWPESFTKLRAFAGVLPSSVNHSLSSIEVLLPRGPAPVLLPPGAFSTLWCPLSLCWESRECSM